MMISTRKRRAMVMIIVLVCLAVAGMLLLVGIKLAMASHNAMRAAGWAEQARWLAESGVDRAAAKLASDANYSGETWNISAKELGGEDAASVKIEVKQIPQQSNSRMIKVEADFPDDPLDRARCGKEIILELN
jgi:hypothetical protein